MRRSYSPAMLLLACTLTQAQPTRDYIDIVGSSTLYYPFATVVAEHFGKSTRFPTPKVESTGSGGGFRQFCAGVGFAHPDITTASRPIKPTERARCRENDVREILEIKIGYDGIVLASARQAPRFHLSRRDLYLALARQVPDPAGGRALIPNPYQHWRQVNPRLPELPIRVLGPPPTSGTRDVFVDRVMLAGCRDFALLRRLEDRDPDAFLRSCGTLREDGGYVESGEDDNLLVFKLAADPGVLGILGFSYLDQNTDRLQGAFIDGIAPGFALIASGEYPLSRPLFVYVKQAHLGAIPGLETLLKTFVAETTVGPDGYLVDKGLIPLERQERRQMRRRVGQRGIPGP